MSIFVNGVELVKVNETTYVTKAAALASSATPVVSIHGIAAALNNMQPVKPGEPVKPSEPVKVVEPAKPMLIGFSCVPETITVQNCSLYVSTDVYNYVANSTNSEFTNDKWTIKCGSHYSDEIRLETGKIIFLSVKSFKGNRSMFKDVFKNHFSLTATDVSDLKLAFAKLTKVVEEKIRKEQVDLAGLESL